ncbi:hypothetical protein [Dechloromonas sp. TW-R-39-2]|nr:hypothetical protein [Dechloromonas sp. TW-R-39-2]
MADAGSLIITFEEDEGAGIDMPGVCFICAIDDETVIRLAAARSTPIT